jgi:hypothetical protein
MLKNSSKDRSKTISTFTGSLSSMLFELPMVDLKKQGQQNNSQEKSDKKDERWQQWRGFRPEEKKKDPDAIPILKCGLSNNFMLFKEALSKKAPLEFGNLGKLINEGFIVMPDLPDRKTFGLDDNADGLNKLDYLEDMKQYRREVSNYKRDKPKLHALIMKYLSDESLEAVQKEAGWMTIEANADPETLWQLVELKHKVHSLSEVEAVMKLAARTQLPLTRQGLLSRSYHLSSTTTMHLRLTTIRRAL